MTLSPTNEPKTAEQIAAFFLGDCVCSKSSEQPCRTTMLATKIKARAQQECRELVEALEYYASVCECPHDDLAHLPGCEAETAKETLSSWKARNQ